MGVAKSIWCFSRECNMEENFYSAATPPVQGFGWEML